MKRIKDLTEQEFEQIERYLAGDLSGEELKLFERRLKSEQEFSEAVTIQKQLHLGVAYYGAKQQLNSIHQQLYPKKKYSTWWWSAAAILLMAIGVWWWQRPEPQLRVFELYYQADPGLPTPMSANNDSYDFYNAMVAYKNGEYGKAIHDFDSLSQKFPRESRYSYYLANSYLNSGRESDAIPIFYKLSQKEQDKYQVKAQWYLAMSFLKSKQYSKLDEILQEPLPENEEKFKVLRNALNEN